METNINQKKVFNVGLGFKVKLVKKEETTI